MKAIDKLLSSETRQEELLRKEEKKIEKEITQFENSQNQELNQYLEDLQQKAVTDLESFKEEIDFQAEKIVKQSVEQSNKIDYSNKFNTFAKRVEKELGC